ncbi:MAG: ComF family protein [Flavobacteriales bacterium]|nr:MAG: ComF family protein [Flavobacteriales bacterium]
MGSTFREVFRQINFRVDLIFNLIFPQKCVHCNLEIENKYRQVCFGCESEINWSRPFDNELKNQILQNIYIENVQSAQYLFSFSKEGVEQSLIHSLKYKNAKRTGINLGRLLGKSFLEKEKQQEIECLIPVPIFYKKKFDRGYNQAESIARGLSLELNIPMRNKLIKKTKNTKSQTKLTKSQRSRNVENTFVASSALSKVKAIGIVDDVLTTGATIREICKEIIKVNETIEITIFTLGVAKHE